MKLKTVISIFSIALLMACTDDEVESHFMEATCDDGIQNGDEEGVDCGGCCCPPCDDDGVGGIDFSGTYVQEDQAGRPGNTVMYVTPGLRNIYNTTLPSELEEEFLADITENIQALNPDFERTFLQDDIDAFAQFLTRDVLWVAQTGPTGYEGEDMVFTGRRLEDDTVDTNLLLLFGGPDRENPLNDGSEDSPLLISDGVEGNDKEFLTVFPYLAAPH